MQKLFDHFKTNAGVWTFGLFMAAIAGGIYQFTVFMVSAQVTPVSERVDAEVKRLDAADGNTNGNFARFEKQMNEHFGQLREAIGQNREAIGQNKERIDRLGERVDGKIALLDRKLERKIEVLDQKIEKKFGQLDQKISRLDEKMDKKFDLMDAKIDKKFDLMDEKFNLILLRLPPLKK